MAALSDRELARYQRQIMMAELDVEGQKRLKEASVLVAGVGGLGCTAATYLAAAGVGRLQLIDHDQVEITNLNRQILHWETDLGRDKVDSAARKLSQLNSDIQIEAQKIEIDQDNILPLVAEATLVIDGMDNHRTRAIINKACVKGNTPFIHAAVYGLFGELLTVMPGQGPCYQCLRPQAPPPSGAFPVLGITPGVMACLQSLEAIKIISGMGQPLIGKMLLFNDMSFETTEIRRVANCPVCGP